MPIWPRSSCRLPGVKPKFGMALAIATTLWVTHVTDALTWGMIVVAIAIGGGIGAVIAAAHRHDRDAAAGCRVPLAGRSGGGAGRGRRILFARGLRHRHRRRDSHAALIEMSLGVAIGAITFAGSLIAFAKLNGNMERRADPSACPALLNLLIFVVIIGLIVWFTMDQPAWAFWASRPSFVFGITLIVPIGGADMPVVISMLNSYSGWAAAGIGFTLENTALIITGALVGSSGAILSYIMCKGMNRSFVSVIAGGFGGEPAAAGGWPRRPAR